MTNSTLSDNTADDGGGIFNIGGVNIQSTLIANSSSSENCAGAAPASLGNSLSDDATCALGGPGDLDDTEDNLGPLANNGGPTQTHVPLAGSPAVDSVPCITTQDQRGISRPQGDTCDIGSVEVRQGSTFMLCANSWTGAVTSPLFGGCPAGTIALDPAPQSFCLHSWTGAVLYTFGRPCNPPRIARTLAADEALLTCVNVDDGRNRWLTSHSQCDLNVAPNTITSTV